MSENAVPASRQHSEWSRRLSWALRSLAMVALFILLTFTVNTLFATLSALSSFVAAEGWNGSFRYIAEPHPDLSTPRWKAAQALERRFAGINVRERSMTIKASEAEIQVAFQLEIPKDDAYAPTLAEGVDNIQPATLTDAFFGILQVDGSYTTNGIFRPAQWVVSPDDNTMRITITAVFPDVNYPVEIRFTPKAGDTIQPARDELLIDLSEGALVSMDPIPHEVNERLGSLVKRSPEELPAFTLELDRMGNITRNEARQSNRLTRRSFLLRYSSIVDNIPLISPLLFAITKSLPLLLFLWLVSRSRRKGDDSEENPNIQILRSLTIILLFFHFTLHVTRGVGDQLAVAAWIEPVQFKLLQFAWHLSDLFALELGRDSWRVQMIILGILTPVLFLLQREAGPVFPLRRWMRSQTIHYFLLLILALLMILAVGTILAHGQSASDCAEALDQRLAGQNASPALIHASMVCGIPVWAWAIILLGSLLLILWGSLVLILWSATGQRYPSLAWVAAALLAIAVVYRVYLQVYPEPEVIEGTPVNYVWFTYAIVLGTFLLWAFALYLYSVYQKLGFLWKPDNYAVGLILVGLLLLAIPALRVFGLAPAGEGESLGIAYRLDNLLMLAWVTGMLFLLYEDGKADLRLTKITLLLGSLALSTLLFNTLARWFYVPITFLLGWAALLWLLATGHDWGSVDEQFKKIAEVRWKLIKHGSLVRILDQAYLKYRSDRFDQVTKGSLLPTQFKQELEKWEREQADASLLQEGELDKELSKHPLAFGPKPTAWENGLHGALWASLFALPWFLIYIVNFMQNNQFPVDYPLLDFLVDLLTIYGRWAAIGFVLGYFFPYLRGDSGLEKGVWLALAVIVPTLPLYFILETPADRWQAAGLWALQVLIQCLLLGLIAFDYQTAEEERGGFYLLLELYGMRSLSLWGATLIAAIGTALVTLLSSQAVNLIGLTLQTILPAGFSGTP